MFVLDNIDERCGANVNIILNLLKLWKKDNEIHLLVQHGEISQIDQQKDAAAVFCGEIGEAPDVAQTDGRACRGQDKAQRTGEITAFLFHS